MGKRLLSVSALATIFLGWLEPASGAYVIKLKNGNEYITMRYWQEGGQVLFDTYGGVFGIEKSFVAKIDETDRPLRLATAADRDPGEKPRAEKSSDPTRDAAVKAPAEKSSERKREADDPVVAEFNRLKDKSQQVGGMLTSEIRALLKEITAFKNKLTKDSKLFIEYGREFNDAHEIATVVETALNARTQ